MSKAALIGWLSISISSLLRATNYSLAAMRNHPEGIIIFLAFDARIPAGISDCY